MTRPEAVIFDMDGTLYDTETLNARFWQTAGEEFHVPNVEELTRACVGRNRKAIEQVMREHLGAEFPVTAFLDRTQSLMREYIAREGCPLKKGAEELIAFLSAEGIPMGMATSSSRATAESRLTGSGLLDHFRVIVGGDMVQHSKPDPEPYRLACRLLGVSPEQCIGVEDSPNGVRSLHDAGLITVMVPDTIAPMKEIRSLCRWVLPSLFDLLELLKQ